MALDWNKEINLSTVKNLFGKKKGSVIGGGATAYPTKRTMNLYQGDQQEVNVRKIVLIGVLAAVLIGAFVKFGVLDQLAMLNQKQAELEQQQALLLAATGSSGNYEEVKKLYEGYTARYGTSTVDAIAVLDLIEQRVKPVAAVSSIVLSDGTLTLTLQNVPLNAVGDLAKDLEGQPLVSAVNVSTATTQNAEAQNTVSTLVVTLAGSQGKEG